MSRNHISEEIEWMMLFGVRVRVQEGFGNDAYRTTFT